MERTRHPRPPGGRAPAQHEARPAERERPAGERDTLADQREQQQDEREQAQDRREAAAAEREREADQRDRDLDERAQALGTAFANLEQRMLETIQRSRTLLAASSHRSDREAETGRVAAESRRREAPRLPDPSKPIERAKALRSQALAAIAAFAATEEEIARIHDELATRHPARRAEHQQLAEHARRTARKAHETLRAFTD